MTVSAQHLLATVWGEEQGWVFLPRKAASGTWFEYGLPKPDNERDIPLDEGNDDLYWCPLVFSQPQRRAEFALPTRFLWADLDGADPAKISLRPSVLWKTSGGDIPHGDHPRDSYTYEGCPGCHPTPHYHALWWLVPRISAVNASKLSRRIAYAEPGADRGGWDVTQVLRVPGTLNHKRERAERVELVYAKQIRYTPQQVMETYPAVLARDATTLPVVEWPGHLYDDVPLALASLSHSVKRTLALPQREIDALDRSLHIMLLAEKLLKSGLSPELATLVLDGSTLVESKYNGRSDRHVRVLAEIEKAHARLTGQQTSA